jgi:hypothetical protein
MRANEILNKNDLARDHHRFQKAMRDNPPSLSPLVTLSAGHWYVTVVCQKCKMRIPLFKDLNNGTSKSKGSYEVKCPICKASGAYDGELYFHPAVVPKL